MLILNAPSYFTNYLIIEPLTTKAVAADFSPDAAAQV